MKNDNAVSPVVATIILVAICIIMAAIIGAFAFGMAGNGQVGRTVGVTGHYESGKVILLTNAGTMEDFGALDHIDVTVNGVAQSAWSPKQAGDTTTYNGPFTHPCEVKLVGHYSPNDQQTIIADLNL